MLDNPLARFHVRWPDNRNGQGSGCTRWQHGGEAAAYRLPKCVLGRAAVLRSSALSLADSCSIGAPRPPRSVLEASREIRAVGRQVEDRGAGRGDRTAERGGRRCLCAARWSRTTTSPGASAGATKLFHVGAATQRPGRTGRGRSGCSVARHVPPPDNGWPGPEIAQGLSYLIQDRPVLPYHCRGRRRSGVKLPASQNCDLLCPADSGEPSTSSGLAKAELGTRRARFSSITLSLVIRTPQRTVGDLIAQTSAPASQFQSFLLG